MINAPCLDLAPLGGGWEASVGPMRGQLAPIVLVTLSRDHDQRFVRLDLGKGMFLDRLPDEVKQQSGARIAKEIVRQLKGHPSFAEPVE